MREDTRKYMEWSRRWEGTHAELAVTDALSTMGNAGSLIAKEPGDKNITKNKPIPGKKIIEAEEAEKRNNLLDRFIHETLELRAKDILDVKYEKLLDLAIKARPRKIEGKMEHEYTFADMVKNASNFEKDLKRAEETRNNTVDAEFTAE